MSPTEEHAVARRLAVAVEANYGHEVVSVSRIAKGMETTNWLVRTPEERFFLKLYRSSANLATEAAALDLSQAAGAAGVPTPAVIPSLAGKSLCSQGSLSFAIFVYVHGATSGVALSRPEMAQSGQVLGRLHASVRERTGLRDIATQWLSLDVGRKRAEFGRYLRAIERRATQDDFDLQAVASLRHRLALLPRAADLLELLPPLARQVLHGDYSSPNILFRDGRLVAVVDFRPPDLFLPAFEIGRAALNPETMTAGHGGLDKSLAFVEEYCRANPEIGQSDVRFAPHVWLIQLVRSDYGLRQHYSGTPEQRTVLDPYWLQRCDAAEAILENLAELSEGFAAAWELREQ